MLNKCMGTVELFPNKIIFYLFEFVVLKLIMSHIDLFLLRGISLGSNKLININLKYVKLFDN